MSHIGKIKIKKFKELKAITSGDVKLKVKKCEKLSKEETESPQPTTTPVKQKKTRVTSKKPKEEEQEEPAKKGATPNRKARTAKKELPPNQKLIDNFFKSCSKSYQIAPEPISLSNKKQPTSARKPTAQRTTRKRRATKRLFEDSTDTETTSLSCTRAMTPPPSKSTRKRKTPVKKAPTTTAKARKITPKKAPSVCIDLCTESEEELDGLVPIKNEKESPNRTPKRVTPPNDLPMVSIPSPNSNPKVTSPHLPVKIEPPVATTPPSTSSLALSKDSHSSNSCSSKKLSSSTSNPVVVAVQPSKRTRKPKPCPPYKVVAGTSFAVDGFQFGQIEGVSHYFLTHFHADHYVGLTRKFAMPLYLSSITARLVRAFIPLEEQYFHEMELGEPVIIEGVEVTAIEANHCPGAVMLLFKFSTGKCILHTGDFRASFEMESEPVFWNNDIDIIYLDTTYLSDKYAFCSQYESIDYAKNMISSFQEKHQKDARILYVCGSYVIGKEKFWSALAREFKFRVWTEDNRRKALKAMQVTELEMLLCDNPHEANMHVITMGKLGYLSLVEYFEVYSSHFDLLLAIRPSGWEKNSKPRLGGKINIIGVEYSEHSSYTEMQRFVTYLKPRDVISTVPVSGDLMKTGKVPLKWYKYDKLKAGVGQSFQPTITSYLKTTTNKFPRNCLMQSFSAQVSPLTSSKVSKALSKASPLAVSKGSPLTSSKTSPLALSKASAQASMSADTAVALPSPPLSNDVGNEENCITPKKQKTISKRSSPRLNAFKSVSALDSADAVDDWLS